MAPSSTALRLSRHLALPIALIAAGPAVAQDTQDAPRLIPPIDCVLGETCEIQQYVDTDPSEGATDFRCLGRTYDGHKGTDFRVPDMAALEAGVDVLVPADGQVLRARDGVADTGWDGAEGRECGNGLVIDHGGGWETQLCHLKNGSIDVPDGGAVEAGDVIGQVGFSGFTQFPHVHISVRRDGAVVDPFDADGGTCGGEAPSLWKDPIADPEGAVLNAGFASDVVTMEGIEAGSIPAIDLATAPALVAYVRAIGLQGGDVQEFSLTGPDGVLAENTADPLDRDKAQWMLFIGKRRPAEGWAEGPYEARYRVIRDGEIALEEVFTLED